MFWDCTRELINSLPKNGAIRITISVVTNKTVTGGGRGFRVNMLADLVKVHQRTAQACVLLSGWCGIQSVDKHCCITPSLIDTCTRKASVCNRNNEQFGLVAVFMLNIWDMTLVDLAEDVFSWTHSIRLYTPTEQLVGSGLYTDKSWQCKVESSAHLLRTFLLKIRKAILMRSLKNVLMPRCHKFVQSAAHDYPYDSCKLSSIKHTNFNLHCHIHANTLQLCWSYLSWFRWILAGAVIDHTCIATFTHYLCCACEFNHHTPTHKDQQLFCIKKFKLEQSLLL